VYFQINALFFFKLSIYFHSLSLHFPLAIV
jgi:hypothetical protein